MTIQPSQVVDKLISLAMSETRFVDKVRDRTILWLDQLLRRQCLDSLPMIGLISSFGGQ